MMIQEKKCPIIKLALAKFIVGVTNAVQKDEYFCDGDAFQPNLAGMKSNKLAGDAVPISSVGAPLNNPTAPRWIAMKFY